MDTDRLPVPSEGFAVTRTAISARTVTTACIAAAASILATLGLPQAQADVTGDFTTPSGNIYCQMAVSNGVPAVACEGGGPYAVPVPEGCHGGWGDRFILAQGQDVTSKCHTDTIRSNQAQAPVLPYGQTQSIGTITCDSESTGLTCTDSSTGKYFSMSREANTTG